MSAQTQLNGLYPPYGSQVQVVGIFLKSFLNEQQNNYFINLFVYFKK